MSAQIKTEWTDSTALYNSVSCSEVIVSVSLTLDVRSHSSVCAIDRVQCLILVTDSNWSHYSCV